MRPRTALVLLSLTICACILLSGCGNTFRPIAQAIPQAGGDPGSTKNAIFLSAYGSSPGTATHIDVSGDTTVAVHTLGANPVHGGLAAGGIRFFTANKTEDTLTEYLTFSGVGASTITVSLPAGSCPVFVQSRGNVNAYVANNCAGTVSVVSLTTLNLQKTVTVGVGPVGLAELPGGAKVYVANQGDNSVTLINTADLSTSTITAGIGAAPSYIESSSDSACVYVANQSSGTVSTINSANDTVVAAPITVGAGPSFMRFDATLRRLYVVNTASNSVSVIAHVVDTAGNCTPALLTTTPIAVGSQPTSIAVLADGTRAYVANRGSNSVSVIDASSLQVRKTVDLTNVMGLPAGTAAGLGPVSIDAAPDSSRVYTANHDSGNFSIIKTGNDSLFNNVPAPQTPTCNTSQPVTCPAPQPNFVLVTP